MDYNTIDFHIIKGVFQSLSREIKKFVKEKPKQKFVFDLLLGVSASGSLNLSKIARKLNEKIKITKTITRLSRNLIDSDEEIQNKITEMYTKRIEDYITADTIFAVDDSDISKRNSKKLEDLGTVRDGSTGEKCVKGYHLAEIVALTANRKEPFAVASKIYSNESEDFKSQNDEWFKLFDKMQENYGNKGIYVMDRGFDDDDNFKYFTLSDKKYVIRMKQNRDLIVSGKKMTINKASDLAVFENVEIITRKNKKRKILYIGCVEVTLPNTQIQANLIVIRGNSSEQMLLLTNLHISRNLIQIIREIYLDRWRIEEYFRLKKQQFNLEKMYVRTLNAMRTLNIIVNIVIGNMCLISEKYKKSNETFIVYKTLVNRAKPIKSEEKVKLYLYRLSSGLSEILSKLQKRLIDYFIPKLDKNIIFGQLMLC